MSGERIERRGNRETREEERLNPAAPINSCLPSTLSSCPFHHPDYRSVAQVQVRVTTRPLNRQSGRERHHHTLWERNEGKGISSSSACKDSAVCNVFMLASLWFLSAAQWRACCRRLPGESTYVDARNQNFVDKHRLQGRPEQREKSREILYVCGLFICGGVFFPRGSLNPRWCLRIWVCLKKIETACWGLQLQSCLFEHPVGF